MTTVCFIHKMTRRSPCQEAVDWLGDRTPRQAWDECPRGDWLTWWVAYSLRPAQGSAEHRALVLAVCDSAERRTSLPEASRAALGTVRRWAEGDDGVDLRAVAYAAYAADAYAAAAYAAYAADAADAYAAAAYAAYAADAADAIRARIPWEWMEARLKEVAP